MNNERKQPKEKRKATKINPRFTNYLRNENKMNIYFGSLEHNADESGNTYSQIDDVIIHS